MKNRQVRRDYAACHRGQQRLPCTNSPPKHSTAAENKERKSYRVRGSNGGRPGATPLDLTLLLKWMNPAAALEGQAILVETELHLVGVAVAMMIHDGASIELLVFPISLGP